jgi:ABC-type antimicrobial peptide transport system permease subunit
VARVAGQMDITASAREILRQQDAAVALFDVESMPDRIADSVKLRRFVAWLLNSFAFVGMALAALGLYGTLAYFVQLRRREIAIRMAFGASARDVANLIARYSVSLALAGLVPGLVLAAAAAFATRSFLFGIRSFDPWTIVLTAACLLFIGLIASCSPIVQAVRVSPLATLREE